MADSAAHSANPYKPAYAAARDRERFEAEPHARRRAGKKLGKLATHGRHDRESLSIAARAYGTNREYARWAWYLLVNRPDLFRAAERGELMLPVAYKMARIDRAPDPVGVDV